MDFLAFPFIEGSYAKLARFVAGASYSLVGVGVPREACGGSLGIQLPGSFRRVWAPLLRALEDPDVGGRIACLSSAEDFEEAVEAGYKVAALLVKATAFGRIDVDEWLGAASLGAPLARKALEAGCDALAADSYGSLLANVLEVRPQKVVVLDTLAPTPLELVGMIAAGLLPRRLAEDAVSYAVKYLRDYVIPSKRLSTAYRSLLRDPGYLKLLQSAGLPVLRRGAYREAPALGGLAR
ncbi:MAG: hypothetical protein ABWK00_05760 [Desulfurococcaceae archaeon]